MRKYTALNFWAFNGSGVLILILRKQPAIFLILRKRPVLDPSKDCLIIILEIFAYQGTIEYATNDVVVFVIISELLKYPFFRLGSLGNVYHCF